MVFNIIEQGVDSRIGNEIDKLSFKIGELVSADGDENMFLMVNHMLFLFDASSIAHEGFTGRVRSKFILR